MKTFLRKSFTGSLAITAAITFLSAGCNAPTITGVNKSGKATPYWLYEDVKSAAKDSSGNNIKLTLDGKNITGPQVDNYSQLESVRPQIATLTVPEGVEKIDDNKIYENTSPGAFKDCTNLTTVTIPSTMLRIGYGSFQGCTSLSNVKINGELWEIGANAFKDCANLKELTLNFGLFKIEENAFSGCKLLNLIIPSSVVYVEDGVFNNVPSVKLAPGNKALIINANGEIIRKRDNSLLYVKPNQTRYDIRGVSRIGAFTFENMTVKEIILCDSITEIGCYAFSGITAEKITLPENLKEVFPYTFSKSVIPAVELPENVTHIWDNAFKDSSIQKITLPKNLKAIYSFAFAYSNTAEIELPETLTFIGESAFRNSKLVKIRIPGKITAINKNTFENSPDLTEVILPEGLERIEERAFYNCYNLSLTLPAGVKDFSRGAFNYIRKLDLDPRNKYYKMDKYGSLTKVSSGSLEYVPFDLTGEFIIPDGVITVPEYVFYDHNKITKIFVPDSVKKFSYQSNMPALTEISISSATEIDPYLMSKFKENNVKIILRQSSKH